MVRQVTAKDRYARAVAAVTAWCREHRHWSFRDQHRRLSSMMRGHFAYYGVGGNSRRLRWFANQAVRVWRKWLSRRHRGGGVPWARFNAAPGPSPTAFSQDPPRIRSRERSSLVKNRMREIRTSGSVRGEGGNILTYSAVLPFKRCEICVEGLAATQVYDLAEEGQPAGRVGIGECSQKEPPEQAGEHSHRQ